jgi:protoheme IX farnesyltransferase
MKNEHAILKPSDTLRGQFAVWSELVKLRLTMMVLITTAMGFYLASASAFDWVMLLHALFGTGLLACGAATLNQYLEKDFDAKMTRTANRPIPAGHIRPERALLTGGALAAIGLVYLAVKVNPITSVIGAVTLVSYIAVYTPLKRATSMNTIAGAIPGALPPLMGWTAAGGREAAITPEGWSLVAILFFWQLPHFLAIAWIYRNDYEKAGFKMISIGASASQNTGRFAVISGLALLPAAISPYLMELSGILYCGGALALTAYFIGLSWKFSQEMTLDSARRLFYYSLLYLPLLLGLMIWDRAA